MFRPLSPARHTNALDSGDCAPNSRVAPMSAPLSPPSASPSAAGRPVPLADGRAAPTAPGGDVSLRLDHASALVVFDLLARLMDRHDADGVRDLLDHPGEVAALWSLMGAFEQALDEPKDADYRKLIASARDDVVARLKPDRSGVNPSAP